MVAKATVAPAQHKDPVSVLKALYLDRERLYDQCYGPLAERGKARMKTGD